MLTSSNISSFEKQLYPKLSIKISAQAHLQGFYNQHGFITEGAPYLEDDIPHVAMYIRKQ